MNRTVTFVIGAAGSGKTTFINNYFADADNRNTVNLDVYDYQQAAYKEAGFDKYIPFDEQFKCLYKANEKILEDIIKALQEHKNVVAEHTLFKAKRRIVYIEAIRKTFENVSIEVYVMHPIDEEIEFPNPGEGFDKIYEVTDGKIRPRMDAPKPEIVDAAHKELNEEAQRMKEKEEKEKQQSDLLESMNSRPFWHYCEVCGAKIYCTAQEAFDAGWDYPPHIGMFGLLGPRKCGKCDLTDTLFWKIQQEGIPVIIKKNLTTDELVTWKRIKGEPESLLEEE